jgi:hypothetical protein
VKEAIGPGAPVAVPACTNGGPRPCWSLAVDAACEETSSHYAIAIDRAGAPPSPDGVLTASCAIEP